MGYQYLEQTLWFESLLIHRPSPLCGLQALFLWLLVLLRSGPVARTWLCFQCFDLPLHSPTENGWLAARSMMTGLKQKIYTVCFASLSFCGESLLKPDLLPHASVDKEVCFLSGQYICSCQQAGQQLTFDLTLIQRNIFGHSIQPPVIGYQCLSSVLVWSLHFLISVLCVTRSKLLCNWFYK